MSARTGTCMDCGIAIPWHRERCAVCAYAEVELTHWCSWFWWLCEQQDRARLMHTWRKEGR